MKLFGSVDETTYIYDLEFRAYVLSRKESNVWFLSLFFRRLPLTGKIPEMVAPFDGRSSPSDLCTFTFRGPPVSCSGPGEPENLIQTKSSLSLSFEKRKFCITIDLNKD